MAQHVESSLLQLVDEQDELTGGARVGHHQQHLRPPELHVVFSHIQHQQILTHLKKKALLAHCGTVCLCVCVCVSA